VSEPQYQVLSHIRRYVVPANGPKESRFGLNKRACVREFGANRARRNISSRRLDKRSESTALAKHWQVGWLPKMIQKTRVTVPQLQNLSRMTHVNQELTHAPISCRFNSQIFS